MSVPLAIAGTGLASSLGWSTPHACAAARAGIVRATELGVGVADPEGEETPVVGHRAGFVTEGFAGVGRLARLTQCALEGLPAPDRDASTSSTGLLLHVSDHYHLRALEVAEGPDGLEEMRSELLAQAWEGQGDFIGEVERCLLPLLAERYGLAPDVVRITHGGPAAFVDQLSAAAQLLAHGSWDRVVVGGVDSLLEPEVLQALLELGVLKTADSPMGVSPGECAAFAVLERADRAGPDAVVIDAVTRLDGVVHRFSAAQPSGEELSLCVTDALQRAGHEKVKACITNLDGDVYRARDFGAMLIRIAGVGLPTDFATWLPAASFGETGAAAGPLSICLAAEALRRGYAGGGALLVALMSDGVDRSSFLVRRAFY